MVNQFFNGLKIKNQKSKLYRQVITDDFFIFEMGKKYSMEELINYSTLRIENAITDWKLSEFRSLSIRTPRMPVM